MSIYLKRTRVNYRKIYETHHGPIPKDENGRTYEIHHIDGDDNNNEISNLIAVSIQEHYNIHHSKEEWGACYAIALRMQISPDIVEELARKNALKRVQNGTHPWKDSEKQRLIQLKLVKEKRSNFSNSEFQRQMGLRSDKKRKESGTHPMWLDENKEKARHYQNNLIESGEHIFLNREWQKNRARKSLESGKHNFLGPNSPTQQDWTCHHCGKHGKNKGMFTRWHGKNCKMK